MYHFSMVGFQSTIFHRTRSLALHLVAPGGDRCICFMAFHVQDATESWYIRPLHARAVSVDECAEIAGAPGLWRFVPTRHSDVPPNSVPLQCPRTATRTPTDPLLNIINVQACPSSVHHLNPNVCTRFSELVHCSSQRVHRCDLPWLSSYNSHLLVRIPVSSRLLYACHHKATPPSKNYTGT